MKALIEEQSIERFNLEGEDNVHLEAKIDKQI
jgi:hypothetical protein